MDDAAIGGRTRLIRGIRVALRNDSTAYAFSLLATATFGIVAAAEGSPSTAEVFLFVSGGAIAFVVFEAMASKFFRQRIRPERSEVVFLGSAFNLVSTLAGMTVAALLAWLIHGWPSWIVSMFGATSVYIILTGASMAAARLAEERNPPQGTG